MTPAEMASVLVARLRARGTTAGREATLGYYPSRLENLGVSVPAMRSVLREARPEIRKLAPAEVVGLARAMIARQTLEGRNLAFEILGLHRQARGLLKARELEDLGAGNDNWGSVDVFATRLAGVCWREGNVSDRDIARWARSSDRWWRRTALVCTVALNTRARGGTGDAKRTLAVCGRLVADRDDMVEKALSWALRELIAHDRAAVTRFLERHEGSLGRRVLREVGNKLKTGRKNP